MTTVGEEKATPGKLKSREWNGKPKPLLTIVLSAYNEGAILEQNLQYLTLFLDSLQDKFDWEIILVNDGSKDNTGALAEIFAKGHSNVRVFHHRKNGGLGMGLQTGINQSKGDYVITWDIDLSCSPKNIPRMLEKIIDSKAKIVIASPSLKGARMKGMPWYRRFLSVCANKFLSKIAPVHVSNLTSMARVYEGEFIRNLNLRSMGMEIMPEIIYKTTIMNGRIEEIPADVIWNAEDHPLGNRKSSMRIFRHTIATLFTGFLLRPFVFFILPGLCLFLFSLYSITWMFIHFFREYPTALGSTVIERASGALETAFQLHQHTFFVAFFSLLISIQLIAVGFQALQNKHYFEELFNLLTKLNSKK